MPVVREINYDGYRFRSKIEAQWYVFFKTLDIDVHYEPETIALQLFNGKVMNYLPDFYIPSLDCYVEIKLETSPTHEESLKCYLLAEQTGKDVYLFYEPVGKKNMNGYKYHKNSGAFLPLQRWTQCPKCRGFDITYQGMVVGISCGCCKNCRDLCNDNSYDIQGAVRAVRGERFGS